MEGGVAAEGVVVAEGGIARERGVATLYRVATVFLGWQHKKKATASRHREEAVALHSWNMCSSFYGICAI